MNYIFCLVKFCMIVVMKHFHRYIIVALLIQCVFLGIWYVDAPYRTVQQSLSIATQHNQHNLLDSPQFLQYQFLNQHHWKVSPLYATVEDIFYPVRAWDHNTVEYSVKRQELYTQHKQQLSSLSLTEKATRVAAYKAFKQAKQTHFKHNHLNAEYELHQQRWLANYAEVFDRKVQLKNGTYNLIGVLVGIAILCGGTLLFGFKQRIVGTLLGLDILAGALWLGSYTPIASLNIPFHWILLSFLLLLGTIQYPKTPSHMPKWCVWLAWSIPCIVATLPVQYAMVGGMVWVAVMSIPILKRMVPYIACIHPFGALLAILTLQLSKLRLVAILAAYVAVMAIVSVILGHYLVTAPMVYFGDIGTWVHVVLLMAISAWVLSNTGHALKESSIALIVPVSIGVVGNIWVPQLLPIWVMSFLWNPLIQWWAVIAAIGYWRVFKQSRKLKGYVDEY